MKVLGIIKETKNHWEKRVALNPSAVNQLVKAGYKVKVQSSPIRIYSDSEYLAAGAEITDDLRGCDFILGVKEIPCAEIQPGIPHLFFSHTIKGQDYNMPMLRDILNKKVTLLDYELIKDDQGRRQVFFGKFAGDAGMIDTLWGLGQRLKLQYGLDTPFLKVKRAYEYDSVQDAIEQLKPVGREIREKGLPPEILPLNFFLMGYGHVASGCREILDSLPVQERDPEELEGISDDKDPYHLNLFVFKEHHMVERKDGKDFDLQDYFHNCEKYQSKMEKYLPDCSVYLNAIYWGPRCPVFLPNSFLKSIQGNSPKLIIIGDITCDIEGSVQATVKATDPDNPIFIYHAVTGEVVDGLKGDGFAVCAVDNFPCEFSREASDFFTRALLPYMAELLEADYTKPVEKLSLPAEIKGACIAHRGRLLPEYSNLYEKLKDLD
ncbi:MAG: hypothetical protein JW996_00640 [Candidatus Cloacimonetes bacterium]|nr:hypothetical protein [Candidatus Cloacimonadota bacterium]